MSKNKNKKVLYLKLNADLSIDDESKIIDLGFKISDTVKDIIESYGILYRIGHGITDRSRRLDLKT